jgi:Predicted transcriptional regulator, consists of a Zn-ribbon and ATP-cone domains
MVHHPIWVIKKDGRRELFNRQKIELGMMKACEKRPVTPEQIRRAAEEIEWALQGTELEFVIMVIAVSCVKLLSAHNSTQHTSRKHKV